MYLAPYLLVASGAWLTDILVLLSVTDSAAWLAGILVLLSVTDSVAWLTDSLRPVSYTHLTLPTNIAV